METRTPHRILLAAALLAPLAAGAQNLTPSLENGTSGSIATPRPINPAAATTNPSARATQALNPYLGSVPDGKLVPGVLSLSLDDAIDHGLKFNLGLIDSEQADATVRAQRERALSALLPRSLPAPSRPTPSSAIANSALKSPRRPAFSSPRQAEASATPTPASGPRRPSSTWS